MFLKFQTYFYRYFLKTHILLLSLVSSVVLESKPCNSAPRLNVLVSIKPIHSLVTSILGDLGEATLLVRGNESPHTYALKASDAKALHSAEIIFRVSNEIEPFLKKPLESLQPSTKIVTLLETPGLTLLKLRNWNTFILEPNESSEEKTHKKKEVFTQETSPKNFTTLDGHIWLDPGNAIILLREIKRNLVDLLPAEASILEHNMEESISEIQSTSNHIKEILNPPRGKPYFVFHDALQYYENYFEFPSNGSITVSSDFQPSVKHLALIRNKISGLKRVCLFSEPDTNLKVLDILREGNSVQMSTLDPEGLLIKPGKSAYTEILNGITYGFQSCLN